MFKMRLVVVAILISSVAPDCWAQLADTPWPTFNRDAQRTGRSPYVGPMQPTEKWRFQMESLSISSIAIGGDGTIYVGDNSGMVYAVNPDGTEKWRFQTSGTLIWSSGPTIGIDGTIYIGTNSAIGEDGSALYALNPDGTEKWQFPVSFHIYGAPALADDGTIYFGCRDEFLYALNPAGEELWSFQTYYFACAPTIGHDGDIFATTYADDFHLYRLNRDGEQVWRTLVGESYGGCCIDANEVIYSATTGGDLVATNPDGTIKWRVRIGSSASVPCIGWDGTIYATGNEGLYAVSPDGDVLWEVAGNWMWIESPIVDREGTVYVANHAFRSDGSLKWIFPDGDFGRTRPAMDRDGTLYVAGLDGWLYAIGPGVGETPIAADPVDFQVITGTHVSGGLEEIVESDDEYLRVRSAPGFRVVEPYVVILDVGFDTDIIVPTSLHVSIESRIDQPSGMATISLRNWSTGTFDAVSTYQIGSSDELVTIDAINATDYVRPNDGRIEVRIKHVVTGVLHPFGFRSLFDQVRVEVE